MIQNKRVLQVLVLLILAILASYIYKHNPYKIEYLGSYNQIWAHKVNDQQKLEKALRYFEGVELDLIYNAEKDILDVRHHPNDDVSITFETYLKAIPVEKQPYLWLDIKNLKKKNALAIYKRVSLLLKNNGINYSKVLIETRNPDALPLFTKNGFITSYYLKPDLHLLSKDVLEKEISEIKLVLAQQPNLAVSFNYLDYEIVANNFPETSIYTWVIDSFFKHGFKVKSMLKNKNVKAVLITYKPF